MPASAGTELRSHACATAGAPRHITQGDHLMKTLRQVTNMFGLAVVLLLGGLQSSGADAAAELAAIHAVDDAWVTSFSAGDADTMAAQYDEHAVLLPPGAPAAKGRAAIRAFFARMIPAAAKDGLAFSLDPNPAGGVRGGMGWSSGT